jgi:hypothetical protein
MTMVKVPGAADHSLIPHDYEEGATTNTFTKKRLRASQSWSSRNPRRSLLLQSPLLLQSHASFPSRLRLGRRTCLS